MRLGLSLWYHLCVRTTNVRVLVDQTELTWLTTKEPTIVTSPEQTLFNYTPRIAWTKGPWKEISCKRNKINK